MIINHLCKHKFDKDKEMNQARHNMMTALAKCISNSDHADELAQAMEDFFGRMGREPMGWTKRMQWSPLLNEIIDVMEESADARIEWDN